MFTNRVISSVGHRRTLSDQALDDSQADTMTATNDNLIILLHVYSWAIMAECEEPR